tara:strand:+ start:401 stop:616 length:216 start_codon:yes stop_codon:yes gene_type:complete
MPFSTYIDDMDMVPILLSYDWMILKDKWDMDADTAWTNCPQEIYDNIAKEHLLDYKHQKMSWIADNHLSRV